MVTALVFIRTDVDAVNGVAETIAALDGVSEVYSVTGDLDLVALVRVRQLDDVVLCDHLTVGHRHSAPRCGGFVVRAETEGSPS